MLVVGAEGIKQLFAVRIVIDVSRFTGNAIITGCPTPQVSCSAAFAAERKVFACSGDRFFAGGTVKYCLVSH